MNNKKNETKQRDLKWNFLPLILSIVGKAKDFITDQKNRGARLKHHRIPRPVGPRSSEQFRDQNQAGNQGGAFDEVGISSAGRLQMYLQAESHPIPQVKKFPCPSQLKKYVTSLAI